MSARTAVLAVNGGSSSLKLALFEITQGEPRALARGSAERNESGRYRLRLGEESAEADSQPEALRRYAEMAAARGLPGPAAVGHRVVHGGPKFAGPALVDDEVLAELRELIPLAPLHLPLEIELIEAAREVFPKAAQVVCFDTAFHRAMPALSRRLPLPRGLQARGVERYGFHGLSYEYVLAALGAEAAGRVVVAHLGAGSSLAAVRDGRPVDTTMGMTPAGGLMMAARCGDLDPGVLLHLLRNEGYDADSLDRLVNKESGLAGVSGLGGDMRRLLELAPREPAAEGAVELYCHVARKHIAAMAASLGGLDQLVFTAGIGEHAAEVRRRICAGLGFLGIEIDPARNEGHEPVISADSSRAAVRVVPTNEEVMVARQTQRLIAGEPA